MGYQENSYIIDPEVEDDEQPIVEKTMESVSIPNNRISRDYEIVEEEPKTSNDVLEEIHQAAINEGLVDEDEEYIGGEGASPEEVIDALIHKERSHGAKENQKEYEDKKVETTRKVIATREILTGMTKRIITVEVPVVLDVKQPNGSVKPELVDLQLKVKRLTESEVNHLFNKRLAGKKVEDMSREEIEEDNHFRSNFLSTVVVEPKMSADVWYYETPAIALGTIFNKVNEVLGSIDDTSLFQ